ncbi:MAG: helix-turn-helix transcriptional regulator [Lachnospiraceae bacterium]|nr:helix-turn-helix transcriptional regulator [Lachnospiraceae bacterium]
MRINAYDREYLENAQKNLGNMLDYAVNSLDYDIDRFFEMFIVSGIAEQFGKGNPTYVVGMTGCELAKKVIAEVGLDRQECEEEMYLDKSPEYWIGWALAFYQWHSSISFSKIQKAVPASTVLGMYFTLHEADITKFISIMDEKMKEYYKDTNLKRMRTAAGYSQSELAREADVALRQIQLLEQRQRDINKAQLETVVKLARALGCQVEDLVEYL